MVFSSLMFIFYFFAPLTLIYYIVPRKAKNIVLFAASLIFYAWGEPMYVFLMLFSAAFNFFCGIWLEKTKRKRAALALNVIANLAILVYFKYTNFIISWAGYLFPNNAAPILNIVMPIGISFYTFQALSYTIDVYRGKTDVQHNFILFGLYLSLFPQLIAGPIVKYNDVCYQLQNRRETSEKFMLGFSRFCAGLCKKVLIANNVGKLWNLASQSDYSSLSASMAWLGVLAFTLQIYFDFSGYSDMAIGLGKIFGFDFLENFDYPYISKSITEFWRRWHISLGQWFKEYVYIPLGGNRVKKARMYLNILIVWALTGLWHGASWNFLLWGLYYAALLVLEKTFLKKLLPKIGPLANVYTMFFVIIGWALFGVEGLNGVSSYLGAMFNINGSHVISQDFMYNLISYAPVLLAAAVISSGAVKRFYDRFITSKYIWIKYCAAVVGLVICIAYLVDDTFNPFLYFRF